jgi:hypothetical protein
MPKSLSRIIAALLLVGCGVFIAGGVFVSSVGIRMGVLVGSEFVLEMAPRRLMVWFAAPPCPQLYEGVLLRAQRLAKEDPVFARQLIASAGHKFDRMCTEVYLPIAGELAAQGDAMAIAFLQDCALKHRDMKASDCAARLLATLPSKVPGR